jgi:hypothetical protein
VHIINRGRLRTALYARNPVQGAILDLLDAVHKARQVGRCGLRSALYARNPVQGAMLDLLDVVHKARQVGKSFC